MPTRYFVGMPRPALHIAAVLLRSFCQSRRRNLFCEYANQQLNPASKYGHPKVLVAAARREAGQYTARRRFEHVGLGAVHHSRRGSGLHTLARRQWIQGVVSGGRRRTG
jgi:hypothetical protein